MAAGDLTTLCSLLRQLAWELAPANAVSQQRYTQVAVGSSTGFGAGGGNLSVTQNGTAIATRVAPIPAGTRSMLLRNLSASKNLLWWTANTASPPANGYNTLASAGVVAIDVRADMLPVLYVMPDPTSTDAGVEVTFSYYD